MSDDLKASELIASIHDNFSTLSAEEKASQIKKTNGIFELQVTNEAKEVASWTIDMKKTGTVYKGPAKPKADLNGQKAFMTGKLKTKGNMMLATKLDGLLKAKPKAKL
ncbi:SCP2 sterol-binding domain-containing protein [Mycena rebaudengoi]|nr:SCP2 sterol-binding domain-containing protein [Mycena rebaudengoi]